MQNLFIITYGRTGSTLLMALLNKSSKFNIVGENHNFIEGLCEANYRISMTKETWGHDASDNTSHPWFGAKMLKDSYQDYNTLISNTLNFIPGKVNGIKEIRHLHMSPDKFSQYMKFINNVFPEAKFIFNFRDFDDVKSSAWWNDYNENSLKREIEGFRNNVDNYLADNSNGIVVNFEDIVNKDVENLFKFIGLELNEAEINEVLGKKHSLNNKKTVPNSFDVKEISDDSELVTLFTDNIMVSGDLLSFGGVYLGKEPTTAISMVVNGERYYAKINLESPNVHANNKDIEHSNRSRFMFSDLPIFKKNNIEVETGGTKVYACLELI